MPTFTEEPDAPRAKYPQDVIDDYYRTEIIEIEIDLPYRRPDEQRMQNKSLPQPKLLTVLFSRGQNDFLHVYELPSPPRIGEKVALLASPISSHSIPYIVEGVQWTPDHTRFDVTVVLRKLLF